MQLHVGDEERQSFTFFSFSPDQRNSWAVSDTEKDLLEFMYSKQLRKLLLTVLLISDIFIKDVQPG